MAVGQSRVADRVRPKLPLQHKLGPITHRAAPSSAGKPPGATSHQTMRNRVSGGAQHCSHQQARLNRCQAHSGRGCSKARCQDRGSVMSGCTVLSRRAGGQHTGSYLIKPTTNAPGTSTAHKRPNSARSVGKGYMEADAAGNRHAPSSSASPRVVHPSSFASVSLPHPMCISQTASQPPRPRYG